MEQTNNAPARPTFLTVLCILTWVGSAIQMVSGVIAGLFVGAASTIKDAAESSMENMDANAAATAASDAADKALGSASTIMIVAIICAILCIVGAVMMWKLKKTGFYVYVAGELIYPIVSMILLGSMGGGAMGVLGLILPIVFVVLYGLNLKSMK
jgi:hypothetical protein